MKKVLTLMGALSVAGSALAHDYDWALLKIRTGRTTALVSQLV